MSTRGRIAAAALACAVAIGCAQTLRVPNLGGLYGRAALQHDAQRNPIIVIPGVLGSRLRDTESDQLVWGSFGGGSVNPTRAEGARRVALPMGVGRPLSALRDPIEPDGVLDRVRVTLLRLPLEQKAYFYLLGSLGAGGFRDEELGRAGAIDYGGDHFTCFQFPYDWRRDNVENAQRLHEFILEKRAYVQAELTKRYGPLDREVRFDIVAHSMGGLLTRYYLRYGASDLPDTGPLPKPNWEGARLVERAVLIGTPNAGSAESLVTLTEGVEFTWLLPRYPAAILGTMPAIYQLLPRLRHARVVDAADERTPLDVYDPAVWERLGWGLASPNQAPVLEQLLPDVESPERRRQIALEHLDKSLRRARRFAAALDQPATPPPGTSLHLIAGDAEATPAVLAAEAGAVRVLEMAPGDGIVTRASAVMDERVGGDWQPELVTPIGWDRVTFLFTDHLGMTKDPAFTDNLLYLLLEEPRGNRPGGLAKPSGAPPSQPK